MESNPPLIMRTESLRIQREESVSRAKRIDDYNNLTDKEKLELWNHQNLIQILINIVSKIFLGIPYEIMEQREIDRVVKGMVTNNKKLIENELQGMSFKMICQYLDHFIDPEFPPLNISIIDPEFSNTTANKEFGYIQWLRPKEFMEDPQLFRDGALAEDIIQGALGNCWFLAALAAFAGVDTNID